MAKDNWKRVAVISDTHGDHIDWEAANHALEAIDDFKPHYRVHLGDFVDLRAIRKGASDEEKTDGIREDITEAYKLLDRFGPTHLTLGNHDYRAWSGANNPKSGMIRDYCYEITRDFEKYFKKNRIKWVPWGSKNVIEIGGFRFLHGYSTSMYAPKAHAMHYGNCAHGHTHRPNQWRCRHHDKLVGICVGPLCSLNMDYALGNMATAEQAHGYLLMRINERTGDFRYSNVIREDDGTWPDFAGGEA